MEDPVVTSVEAARTREAFQSAQPVTRPSWWGVDRDRARRPGVPMMRAPQPWPHTRFPPERQQGEPSSPVHGRPNKRPPPVFGTAVPLHGLSGVVRRAAYRHPDHDPAHWLLKMLGDRVDSWSLRARRALWVVLPAAAVLLAVRRARRA
jgi:hypothetical protein